MRHSSSEQIHGPSSVSCHGYISYASYCAFLFQDAIIALGGCDKTGKMANICLKKFSSVSFPSICPLILESSNRHWRVNWLSLPPTVPGVLMPLARLDAVSVLPSTASIVLQSLDSHCSKLPDSNAWSVFMHSIVQWRESQSTAQATPRFFSQGPHSQTLTWQAEDPVKFHLLILSWSLGEEPGCTKHNGMGIMWPPCHHKYILHDFTYSKDHMVSQAIGSSGTGLLWRFSGLLYQVKTFSGMCPITKLFCTLLKILSSTYSHVFLHSQEVPNRCLSGVVISPIRNSFRVCCHP